MGLGFKQIKMTIFYVNSKGRIKSTCCTYTKHFKALKIIFCCSLFSNLLLQRHSITQAMANHTCDFNVYRVPVLEMEAKYCPHHYLLHYSLQRFPSCYDFRVFLEIVNRDEMKTALQTQHATNSSLTQFCILCNTSREKIQELGKEPNMVPGHRN